MRYAADGSGGEVFASGLRNSVGLAFAPWDGSLYATDNGRDMLGDDYPPCELNRVVEGGFYGWPYLNGDNKLDPDFGAGKESLKDTAIVPAYSFRAHNAPLGIHFIPGQKSALVALHGSWNRSIPDGYKIVRLNWRDDGSIAAEDFMWGFEDKGNIVGRPVDIVSDGSGGFFVSDDFARVIYRLSPAGSAFASAARGTRPEAAPATALDMALATQGEALFAAMPCGECHGVTAMTPVELRDLAQRYSVDSLTDYFLTPTPPMPRFELSLEQRRQLAHYLLSREQFQAEM
jgi:cytochrome c553